MKEFKVGELVVSNNPRNPLICGSGRYPCAVVIKTSPLILMSTESDMEWSRFPLEDLTSLETMAHPDVMALCNTRLVKEGK